MRRRIVGRVFACCDESGNDKKARWWVFGVAWLPEEDVPRLEAEAIKLRQDSGCWGEFKWGKVSAQMVGAYQGLLSAAFGFDKLRFTSMVVEKRLLTRSEVKKYHQKGGSDEAYLKFMRLLLAKRIERLAEAGHDRFTILYDNLSASRDLQSTLQDVLRRDIDNISGRIGQRCRFDHLAPVDSKTLHLVQVADLITGATRYAWEGSGGGGNEPARAALREQIEEWAGGSLTHEGFRSTRFYNLWRWRPSGG